MNIKKIKIKDHILSKDNKSAGIRGQILFGKGRKQIPYIDPYGNPAYYSTFEEIEEIIPNIVPIGAYQFVFNKLFNIGLDKNSTLRVGDLNDEAPQMRIGVGRREYESIHYNAECSTTNSSSNIISGVNIPAMMYIFGFMIGDGGSREDNVTAISPDYKSRTLNHAIPFRMSNDGMLIPDNKYFGIAKSFPNGSSIEPIDSYYVKTFDDPAPRIIHVWVTENNEEFKPVDESVFSSTSSFPIESYAEMNISVNINDVRGYASTTGSTSKVNEFALVSGWYNQNLKDYESLRLFTKFSRSSITLSDGDHIEAIYRLYAR